MVHDEPLIRSWSVRLAAVALSVLAACWSPAQGTPQRQGDIMRKAVLQRLEAGETLSTREMMEYRRQPDAVPGLIFALRQGTAAARRAGVGLLVDVGRVLIPAEGVVPERPGPIVDSPEVVSYLVERLADPDREVRRTGCVALAALVPGAQIKEHAKEILESLERYPATDGAIVLLGKTGSPEALAALRDNPALSAASAEDAEMARARLGDEKAEAAVIAAYEAAADVRAKVHQARRLGYVGSDRAVRLLARDIRTPEAYVWSGVARRSLRVHIIEGLHLAFLTEPIFWPPFFHPSDDSYYEKIEQWLAKRLGITWQAPRPPFLYQEQSPTPPMRPAGLS
jgi:hypothetical protein